MKPIPRESGGIPKARRRRSRARRGSMIRKQELGGRVTPGSEEYRHARQSIRSSPMGHRTGNECIANRQILVRRVLVEACEASTTRNDRAAVAKRKMHCQLHGARLEACTRCD